MNTTATQTNGAGGGNWIAFVFGAVFNLMANINLAFLVDYILQAIIGGIICLAFKIIGDVLSPLWLKHRDKIKGIRKMKKLRKQKKESRRDGKD